VCGLLPISVMLMQSPIFKTAAHQTGVPSCSMKAKLDLSVLIQRFQAETVEIEEGWN
jgi:hypothetical protein